MKLSNIFAALALAATAVTARSAINAQVEDLPANVTVGQTVEIQYSLGERASVQLAVVIKGTPDKNYAYKVIHNFSGYEKVLAAGAHTQNWTIPAGHSTDGEYAIYLGAAQTKQDGFKKYSLSEDRTKYFEIEPAS